MAFDYCSAADAFAYGGSAGTATDPVNEAAVMSQIVTAVSRAIDRYCSLFFSQATYTATVLRGVVDRDGVLSCYPPVSTMTDPTDTEYRSGNSATWLSISGADIEEQPYGCVVRFLGVDLSAIRTQRIQVRMSYTGGYATAAELPPDLAWAARALSWYTFQKRSAPMERTAIPELGVLVIPGQWPADIRRSLDRFRKVVAS